MPPLASIIIITKDQRRFLEKSLPAIRAQTEPDVEIIIVDSSVKEDNTDLFKKYRAKQIAIAAKTFNYAAAFNRGAKIAKGQFLVRLSGDVVPANKHWLKTLLDNFADTNVAGVYSRWINTEWAGIFDKYIVFMSMRKKKLYFDTAPNWNGASGALRRDLWEKYPFDARLSFCEDWDWSRRVQKAHYIIVYEPASVVYHSHRENILRFMLRGLRTMRALVQIYFGW
jgi:GT2 family glycosyltransferase